MSQNLSSADQNLSPEEQAEIKRLKQAWADANAAGDQAGMDAAHQAAEAIRNRAGYSGGADGSGYSLLSGGNSNSNGTVGGKSADEVQRWVDDYRYTNLDADRGWINGYSTDMNLRSMANYIRQQMQANSDAWHTADAATREYLHDQNVQLAKILEANNGGAQSVYNEELGRWETWNGNLGYGYNHDYDDEQFQKEFYGMTDEQIQAYRNDTSRYRNYVDQRVIRNWVDDTSGYTGLYAQFVNGPYAQLLTGTKGVNREVYIDTIGDGFAETDYVAPRDADGSIVPRSPALKDNNAMTDYTRQFASYVDENGVIQPGKLVKSHPGGWTGSSVSGGSTGTAGSGQASSGGAGLLDQWQQAARQQVISTQDYAVSRAVQELLAAQAEANALYQTQRDQIAKEERNALDNSALYAQTRGDRGGIGQTQYNAIQAAAAANRQAVNSAQTQMAAQTARQIAQLRADGEFEKADSLLEISQAYLLKLLDLEQWAAEYGLDVAQFQASLQQWQQEFWLKAATALI